MNKNWVHIIKPNDTYADVVGHGIRNLIMVAGMGSSGNDFTDLVLGSCSSYFNVFTIAPSFLDV